MEAPQNEVSFESLCVIEFAAEANEKLKETLKRMITEDRRSGGAGLECFERTNVRKLTTFHLGCPYATLLEVAEYVNMKKRCVDGTLRVFSRDKLDSFEHSQDPELFFVRSERQRLVLLTLESVRSPYEGFILPGHEEVKVHQGSSIMMQCVHQGLITKLYPLHDNSLASLEEKWYRKRQIFSVQPLDEIKSYFGETIAIYFGFLDFYTKNLILPAAVGLLYVFLDLNSSSIYSLIVFSIINIIWSAVFLEGWKQKSSSLAYVWGTHDIKIIEEARPSFHGEMAPSAVTGKLEPAYPKWRRMLQFYCISLPVICFCLALCFAVLWLYLEAQDAATTWYKSVNSHHLGHHVVSFLPTVLYSVALIIMNNVYRPLATKLNEWENHRLQSTFDSYLIVKLVSFWFINTFSWMFYAAFYLQDLAMLRKSLLIALIVTQAVDQMQETVLPYCLYILRKRHTNSLGDGYINLENQDVTPSAAASSENEADKDVYQGTFDDFLELFIQFGYVTLFSAILPLAAVFALANNITELRTDAFKLCQIHQRPFSHPTASIGVWQGVFTMMGYLAIITNCALIGVCARDANLLPGVSDLNLLLIIGALEHFLILLRVFVGYIIPDQPKSVRLALARDEYRMKMAVSITEQTNKKTN